MDARVERLYSTGRAVLREVRAEDVTFMAGSVAYHAFVSLLPVLVLLTLVVSTVGSETLATEIVGLVVAYFPPSVQSFVGTALSGGPATHVSLVSSVALLWGTFKIFRALDAAFAEIYDAERRSSPLHEAAETVLVLLAVVLSVVALGITGTAFAFPDWLPLTGAMNEILSVGVLMAAFLPMYYAFPNTEVTVREILPGVVVAALGWKALQVLFQLYAAVSTKSTAYGVAGGVLLALIWLYFGGLVLLVGAAVNAVLAGKDGDVAPGARQETSADRGRTERPSESVESEREFALALDRLVAEARDGGVPEESIRRALRTRADDRREASDEKSR
ncbi:MULTISPECIES: YihY/virulence factor BrkB family protein [Halorussus]|uniref:YihY/virulence factor BrkB family protein n=1 Tax=Halorussus TaxID=1070314 RepID=UPI00209CC101|nr:YihY/virulence factor BrkB family protein [Halorussus vallis]USZ77175.1 YihY/virulence factor BrkB family protein [Halorussus vallis]